MRFAIGLTLGALINTVYSARHASSAQCLPFGSSPCAFSPDEYRSFPLVSSYDETHNARVFRFALKNPSDRIGLPVAACVTVRFIDKDGKEVVRPYTPINSRNDQGHFDLLVKRYKGAKMGNHLFALKNGDTIEVKGPWVKTPVRANQYSDIGLIAGGTGITPMYQVVMEVLGDPSNHTNLSLISANHKKEDILLGNELNLLMDKYNKFSVYHVLSQPPSNWMGGVGRVNAEMIQSRMPSPEKQNILIMVCGPPGFMKTVSGDKDFSGSSPTQGELLGLLKDLGYTSRQVFKF